MPSFYTRTGDQGVTGLLGKERVQKFDLRIETLGAIDETSAALGLARSVVQSAESAAVLLQVQRDLYRVMGEVAATPDQAEKFRAIGAEQVGWLEESIERLQVGVEMPGEFIVPGDTLPAAMLDVARTIARRAERRLVELFHQGELGNPELLRYLNRLSSLCYVIELKEHHESGIDRPTLARK